MDQRRFCGGDCRLFSTRVADASLHLLILIRMATLCMPLVDGLETTVEKETVDESSGKKSE